MNPVVIAVAITGSVPRKKDNPGLPITPSEQIESTHQAFEAGATLVHIHVRNDDESSSSDPARFEAVQAGVRKHCPGMIVQFSTGGRGRDQAARGSSLYLKPDMASLSTGSVNFPTIIYENHPTLVEDLATKMKEFGVLPEIEIFDLSHLHGALRLTQAGLMNARPHVQFVMGVKNAMPVDRAVFDFYIETLKRLSPESEWCGAGIGPNQIVLNDWCVSSGGHARTGLEDNLRLDKTTLAPSNAALVERVVDLCNKYERPVATAAQARNILGLAQMVNA